MANFPVVSTPVNTTPTDRSGTVNGCLGAAAVSAAGSGYAVNDTITFVGGAVIKVTTVASGGVTAATVLTPGSLASGSIPANPVSQVSSSGGGTGAQFILTWLGVATSMVSSNTSRKSLEVVNPGSQVLWVSPTTTAAANGPGSLPVYPGGSWVPPLPYSGAISVYGPAAGQPVTIYEG
ncbi:hypothetical protein [Paraburkholderia sp. BL10I2N1]|uniref:hypothetical protein n=1 Tax=Paraburkholderia sp. BL10I2N1 TaxID=1938796 RepID=UPI00105F19A3|nr:hypothetical protein [Paraburkholderia sp. BL10I2N1]TDN70407.1 hypothetical protein B0G77_3880 [Paraburkholderia sp. BL10I2N1]